MGFIEFLGGYEVAMMFAQAYITLFFCIWGACYIGAGAETYLADESRERRKIAGQVLDKVKTNKLVRDLQKGRTCPPNS